MMLLMWCMIAEYGGASGATALFLPVSILKRDGPCHHATLCIGVVCDATDLMGKAPISPPSDFVTRSPCSVSGGHVRGYMGT